MPDEKTESQFCEDCVECTDENCKARPTSNFVKRTKVKYMYCTIVRGNDPVCPNGFKPKGAE
ncbi:hypothetical protein LCGC14_1940780 [marine sediment metagenome]|uniref:Uncharacterized protein n=1 Tax=marine sediment metagenome TaxID=412755 RepID=A0A0F9IHN5_9ZZZZ